MAPLASFRSIAGLVLATGYLIGAGYVVQDELRHTGGGWINLRGFGTKIVTAPSEVTLGSMLRAFGVKPVNYGTPGVAGYLELALHLVITATVVYALGWGVEWLVRRFV